MIAVNPAIRMASPSAVIGTEIPRTKVAAARAVARAAIRDVRWTATEDGIERANVSSTFVSRTARDVALVGLCWAAARIVAIYGLGPSSPTMAFDEAQYLEESFLLASGTDAATGAPAVFYKGPFVYLLAAGGMTFAPGRAAASGVALLMDL